MRPPWPGGKRRVVNVLAVVGINAMVRVPGYAAYVCHVNELSLPDDTEP